jgi:hypothetical protein
MDIRVQSYSGHRGEETPRFLLTESRKIKVKKILDEDDALYIIRHDQKTWNWELTFYRITEQPFKEYSERDPDHRC